MQGLHLLDSHDCGFCSRQQTLHAACSAPTQEAGKGPGSSQDAVGEGSKQKPPPPKVMAARCLLIPVEQCRCHRASAAFGWQLFADILGPQICSWPIPCWLVTHIFETVTVQMMYACHGMELFKPCTVHA